MSASENEEGYYCRMAKGRTKNKRSRKTERPMMPADGFPKPYPVAYFSLPDKRQGFAEASSGGRFYQPSEPVMDFRITIIPNSSCLLGWTRSGGWSGNLLPEELAHIIPEIERSFSPLRYRFRLIFE